MNPGLGRRRDGQACPWQLGAPRLAAAPAPWQRPGPGEPCQSPPGTYFLGNISTKSRQLEGTSAHLQPGLQRSAQSGA
jgi:hypothetical protein